MGLCDSLTENGVHTELDDVHCPTELEQKQIPMLQHMDAFVTGDRSQFGMLSLLFCVRVRVCVRYGAGDTIQG